ncbi:MAG: hypothetical protein AAB019_05105 [Planctomycetota bacterium]
MKPKFFILLLVLFILIGFGFIFIVSLSFQPAPNPNLFFQSKIIKFSIPPRRDDLTEEYHLWLKVSFLDKAGQPISNPSGWLITEGFGADKYKSADNPHPGGSLLMTRVLQKETDFKEILKQISLAESSNPVTQRGGTIPASPASPSEAGRADETSWHKFFPPQAYVSNLKSPVGLFAFYNKDFFIHLKSGFKIQNERNYLSLNVTYLEQAPIASGQDENNPAGVRQKTQTLPLFEY